MISSSFIIIYSTGVCYAAYLFDVRYHGVTNISTLVIPSDSVVAHLDHNLIPEVSSINAGPSVRLLQVRATCCFMQFMLITCTICKFMLISIAYGKHYSLIILITYKS